MIIARSTSRWYNALLLLMVLTAMMLPAFAENASISSVPPEVVQYAKDWPLPNKDYSNSRATNDSSISSANAGSLGVAWSFKIPGIGTYGGGTSNPIIQGETVYFQDLRGNVFALDLNTGKTLWEREFNSSAVEGPNGPAVGWGKVFIAKDILNMTALNSSDGSEIWTVRLSNRTTNGIDIQPAIYGGMIYISTVPGTGDIFYAPGGIGILYAMDQATGETRWNFSTVDSPNLWGHPEVNSGGGAWYTPAIDTNTGLTFWGIGNPAPWPGTLEWPNGTSRPGPNLYTNSIMAIDHASGSLEWYNQIYPHDLFDLDFQVAPILASANISGKQQDIVLGAGKMGRVYAFNRSTGSILWATVVGRHENDQLGLLPNGTTTEVYPSSLGGVETPMAYADGKVYVAYNDLASYYTPTGRAGSNISQGKGGLTAINADTGQIIWTRKFNSLNVGAATVINDLVFTASYDGNVYAFKKDTGERVWKYTAPAGINGWPAVAGDTIVWPAGLGNATLVALRLGENLTTPQIMITEPKEGAVLGTNNVTVSVKVSNFNLSSNMSKANVTGEGHIHYFMDVIAPTIAGRPALTASGTWTMASNTSYTWKNVSQGMHNFSAELVNNDHTPLSPPVVDTVTVTVPNLKAISAPRTVIYLDARNMAFNQSTITVPAGAQVTIQFRNDDQSISHNFAVYTDSSALKRIFSGNAIVGPASTTYTFNAPTAKGSYFFRCDIHPTQMTGQFIVA
ncbi:MAG TPA: PQQ-binding-like beta-propeller repeat protein [Methanotrichaceae archaeon]|nr:PQQ-binding-like beta-propeller repeat protein [Methanotrichaceae archaeon]